MRRLRAALLTLAATACLAPSAHAAVTVEKEAGGGLKVTSDDAGDGVETFALSTKLGFLILKMTPGPVNTSPGTGCSTTLAGGVWTLNCSFEDLGGTRTRIVAGKGGDTITDNSLEGSSLLEGNGGADKIETGSGTDAELLGQAGGDTLKSASNFDTMSGGDEADTLIAAGNKSFNASDTGGPGGDTFTGNPDLADRPAAEPGPDTYNLGTHIASGAEETTPTLQLFNYPDSVSYGAVTEPVNVSEDGAANDGRSGEKDNVAADVEILYGGTAADVLSAGPNTASLKGEDGADQLLGGPAPDQLSGGQGNDILRGGDGDDELDDGDFTIPITSSPQPPAFNDVLDGGGGDDELNADRGADDVSGGPGVDLATFFRKIPQGPSVATPLQTAGFTISLDDAPNDGQTGSGEGDNIHSDIEAIETDDGPDTITGSPAANEIESRGGNDTVDPGAGPDLVDLGPGDDSISAVDQTTDVIRCRSGLDTAVADLPGDQAQRADSLSDCENVSGTPFPAVNIATPKLLITLSSKTTKVKDFLKNGHLDVKITCSQTCSATGEAYTTGAKISRAGELSIGTGTLKSGFGTRTLQITVPKKFRNQLKPRLKTKAQQRRGLKFRVGLVVEDGAGNGTSASRTLAVRG